MFKRTKKFLTILFFVLLVFLFLSSFGLAQDLEIDYPEIGGIKPETVKTGLPEYAKYIFNFAIAATGLIVLAALIWGGFLYLTSTGNPDEIKTAKEQITASILSLIILFSSYLILATVNPELLIFSLPSLTPGEPLSKPPPEPPQLEQASLISAELPLGQAVKEDLWSEEKIIKIKGLIGEFKNFLTQKIKINDPDLKNDTYELASDLGKYLKTQTDECRCENLRALCTKPETGALPVGCNGDPCQIDQDSDIEPDSPRGKINKVLEIIRGKMKNLLVYQEKIISQKTEIRESLRKFQEIENEVSTCEDQKGELITLSEYLVAKQFSEKYGDKTVKIQSHVASRGDPLTFYCSAGGTVFDYPYTPASGKYEEELEKWLEQSEEYEPTQETKEEERMSCPFKISLGETLDNLRELAVITIIKMERVSALTEQMTKELQEMTELVSQCNDRDCQISCACVPNPCYQCCSPIPCGFCAPFCRSRCLQGVQTCNGDACPVAAITEQSEKIKRTEDKIFETIQQIEEIFPQVSFLLKSSDNPDNLEKITIGVNLCYSTGIEEIKGTGWLLSTCGAAKGNYNPTGELIKNCHPRNFYCCATEQQTLLAFRLPLPTDKSPVYIVPSTEFQVLPSENNCPKGWLCNDLVKQYNQYNDASEPLKQLLSCSRRKLDIIQKKEGLSNVLGRISAISDPKLYEGTCDWETGPKQPGGCSHTYEINRGKERVSDHYGGILCRHSQKSYAFDLDFSDDFQKKYVEEIIKTIKECSPGARILDKIDHLHIGIGEENQCKSSDF